MPGTRIYRKWRRDGNAMSAGHAVLRLSMALLCLACHCKALHAQPDSLPGSKQVERLNQLVLKYEYVNPDSAKFLVDSAIRMAEYIGDKAGLSDALLYDGYLEDDNGAYYKALGRFRSSMMLAKEVGDSLRISKVYNNYGIIYYDMGLFNEALKNYYRALELQEFSIRDSTRIHVIRLNIANVFTAMKEDANAIPHLKKAEKYFVEKGLRQYEGISYLNQATCYLNLGKPDSALVLLNKGMAIYKETGDEYGQGQMYIGLGSVFYDQHEVGRSLEMHVRALDIFKKLRDQYYLTKSLRNIAVCHLDLGHPAEAESYINMAIDSAKKINSINILKETYQIKARIMGEGGRDEEALLAFKRYANLKDSIFNEDKSKEIGRLEARYEIDKEEQEALGREKERRRVEEEAVQWRNNLQYSAIMILLVILGTGVLFLAKLAIPAKLGQGLVFLTFLLFFEFMLVLLDPFIEGYTGGAPAYKLLCNAGLAILIFPLHNFLERRLRKAP